MTFCIIIRLWGISVSPIEGGGRFFLAVNEGIKSFLILCIGNSDYLI